MTSRFYRAHAASFAQTRQTPWQGWHRLLAERAFLAPMRAVAAQARPMYVFDLGCGNLRFERFLLDEVPTACDTRLRFCFYGADDCPELVSFGSARACALRNGMGSKLAADSVGGQGNISAAAAAGPLADEPLAASDGGAGNAREAASVNAPGNEPPAVSAGGTASASASAAASGRELMPIHIASIDAISAFITGDQLAFDAPACDIAVAFGFLHHVPGSEARVRALQSLAAQVRPGGVVAVSLWRFAEDEKLAARALEATHAAVDAGAIRGDELDGGDWLLGWQGDLSEFRYCHSFDDGDIKALIAAVQGQVRLTARFRADGASSMLNDYLIFERL